MAPSLPLLGLLCLLHLGCSQAAKIGLACEKLTGIDYCTECSGSLKKCFLCHNTRAPVWTTAGTIKECKATTTGITCTKASGDPNCVRCDGIWCTQCKAGFYFDKNYKCITSTNALTRCRGTSKNPGCAACNPDGTCTKCSSGFLMPLNAIYINAGFPESTCLTLASLNQQAKSITWNNAVTPTNCIEVDTDFKCNRCKDGYSLTGGACKTPIKTAGSKCNANLPYQQYCAACNAAGTSCITCNGSRGLVVVKGAAQCQLPCKQLFGIGCKRCTATTCTQQDPLYANGRR